MRALLLAALVAAALAAQAGLDSAGLQPTPAPAPAACEAGKPCESCAATPCAPHEEIKHLQGRVIVPKYDVRAVPPSDPFMHVRRRLREISEELSKLPKPQPPQPSPRGLGDELRAAKDLFANEQALKVRINVLGKRIDALEKQMCTSADCAVAAAYDPLENLAVKLERLEKLISVPPQKPASILALPRDGEIVFGDGSVDDGKTPKPRSLLQEAPAKDLV